MPSSIRRESAARGRIIYRDPRNTVMHTKQGQLTDLLVAERRSGGVGTVEKKVDAMGCETPSAPVVWCLVMRCCFSTMIALAGLAGAPHGKVSGLAV